MYLFFKTEVEVEGSGDDDDCNTCNPCGPCSGCSTCALWGPIQGGNSNVQQCAYIPLTITQSPSTRLGGGGVQIPDVNLGGGGGGGGNTGSAAGHGGSVSGVVVASAGSNSNNGFYDCNGDNIYLNGNVLNNSNTTVILPAST
jgi:hypothetical protein